MSYEDADIQSIGGLKRVHNTQRNLVGSDATTNTGETGILGHREDDKVSKDWVSDIKECSEYKNFFKHLLEENSNELQLMVAGPSLQSSLRKLVGLTLKNFADKVSYMNLYQGNKYGVGGYAPDNEALMQKFLNSLSYWLHQKIMWPKVRAIEAEIEAAKKGKFSKEFEDYAKKEKDINTKRIEAFKNAIKNKVTAYNHPDVVSASSQMSQLSMTHPWKQYENELRKEMDKVRKESEREPIETKDVTPMESDIPEAKETFKTIQELWNKIHSQTDI